MSRLAQWRNFSSIKTIHRKSPDTQTRFFRSFAYPLLHMLPHHTTRPAIRHSNPHVASQKLPFL